MDHIMLHRLLQGTLFNTLTVYLRELELLDGPAHPSSRRAIDDSADSDDDQPSREKFKAFGNLKVQHHSNVVALLEFRNWK